MGSASGSKHPSRPMKKDVVVSCISPSNPNGESTPCPNPKPEPDAASTLAVAGGPDTCSTTMSIDGAEEDEALALSEFLSREEVLRRRSRRLKQLSRCYRRQYWALMEEIRVKHRDYYWEFGKSPVEEDSSAAPATGMVMGAAGLGRTEEGNGSSQRGERKRCSYIGCKSKAMPLTTYCHPHILSDAKQTLYKPCSYVVKSTHNGPQICAKPVLRAAVPSLCPVHFQKAQRQILQALKKAGLNVSSSSKPVPKLNVLIAECVKQIQAKRRRRRSTKVTEDNIEDKDE